MACGVAPMIEVARRDATIARRQVIRAQHAVKIAGPSLRPDAEAKLLEAFTQCGAAFSQVINLLNSGVLDTTSDDHLDTLAADIAKLVVGSGFIIEGCKTLTFRRKASFKASLETLGHLSNRLASIREGLALSKNDSFNEALSTAVSELSQSRQLVAH